MASSLLSSSRDLRLGDGFATIGLVVAHALLVWMTSRILGLAAITTDACGTVPCGNPRWFEAAFVVGVNVGWVVFAAFAAAAAWGLVTKGAAFVVPLAGCVAQIVLLAAAWMLAWQAGPV